MLLKRESFTNGVEDIFYEKCATKCIDSNFTN